MQPKEPSIPPSTRLPRFSPHIIIHFISLFTPPFPFHIRLINPHFPPLPSHSHIKLLSHSPPPSPPLFRKKPPLLLAVSSKRPIVFQRKDEYRDGGYEQGGVETGTCLRVSVFSPFHGPSVVEHSTQEVGNQIVLPRIYSR